MEIPPRYQTLNPAQVTDPVFLDFLRKFPEPLKAGKGMFISGNNGVGKTAFSVLTLMHARRWGYPGLFLEAQRLKELVFEQEWFDESETYWDRIREVPVLVMDDLGKEAEDQKNWMAQLMDQVVRHRTMQGKSTLLTSNSNPEDLVKKGLIWASTFHAMKESTLFYTLIGKDLRGDARKMKNEHGILTKLKKQEERE
jgi:DNA replication protein DnaC